MENETPMASKIKSRIISMVSLLPSTKTVVRAMKRATSRIPFIDDVLAMYYCAIDPKTPTKIRIVIGAALLYLVSPFDIIPDFLPIIGYADDVTTLMAAFRLVSSHVTDAHRQKARSRLDEMQDAPQAEKEQATP